MFSTFTADAGWRSLSLYVIASLSAASVLYFAVERPFLRLPMGRVSKEAIASEVRVGPSSTAG